MKNILLSCSLLGMFFANAQVSTLEENFETFGDGTTNGALPQKGWNYNEGAFASGVRTTNGNKHLQMYSMSGSDAVYFISPELTSIDGVKSLKFDVFSKGGPGAIQIGVVKDADNSKTIQNFEAVSGEFTISGQTTTYEVNIPKSDAKYIVFKLIAKGTPHTPLALDNIYYKDQNLSTSEIANKTKPKFAVDNAKNQIIFADNNIRSVKIFSANGSLVSNEKVVQNQVNISKLNSGVYFIILEDNNGNITKSKFIKK